ncbi:MAG TPA: transketolase C-terminal domain-containing protein, partial [bacterium]|nr:transketolase C-terminal domain-containing protein [bacterium]
GDVLHEGTRLAILALGTMVEFARETAALLASSGLDPTVVNMRFVKPLDRDLLRQLAQTHTHFVTYEDHVLDGGFGGAVCEALEDEGLHDISVMRLGLPDRVIEHGSREEIFGEYGLLPSQVAPRVSRFVLNARFAY